MVLKQPSVIIPRAGVSQLPISVLLLAEKDSAMLCTYHQQMRKTKRNSRRADRHSLKSIPVTKEPPVAP